MNTSRYYMNTERTENPYNKYEVHRQDCHRIPVNNRIYLGLFRNGIEAVDMAKRMGFRDADGCAICIAQAHHE